MAHKQTYSVVLGERGRLVLPAELRREMKIAAGDRLILIREPGGDIHMLPAHVIVDRFAGSMKHLAEGHSMVDELIQERREDARREDEEARDFRRRQGQ